MDILVGRPTDATKLPSGHLKLEQRWNVVAIRSWRCSKLNFNVDQTYSACRVDGFQQWSFRRLVCRVQFLAVFSRRQFFKWPPHTNRRHETRKYQTCLMTPKKLYKKTTTDKQKLVYRTRLNADATKSDSHQLAKNAQFRCVGWYALGIKPRSHLAEYFSDCVR